MDSDAAGVWQGWGAGESAFLMGLLAMSLLVHGPLMEDQGIRASS